MSASRKQTLVRKSNDARVTYGDTASDDDDEESDTLTELSRESLTSSQGRSSIGSIPWAEDAIKQNQTEWERIERMFYGEEELPTEPKLREEILEWTAVFPYLRVTGRPIPIVESVHAKANDPFHEEVFAVDPAPISRSRSSRSGKDGKHAAKDLQCELSSCELDKCLYISSGVLRNTHAKVGRRLGVEIAPEFVDRNEKPFSKVKPLNSLMVPQVPMVPIGTLGLLISTNSIGAGNYHAVTGSRNCSAQSVSFLSHNTEASNNGGRSRNINLHRKLAPLPHRPHQQQQQQHYKHSKPHETTLLSASASATHNRIPPLAKNYKFLVQNSQVAPTLLAEIEQRHSKLNVVKSATTRYVASSPTKQIFALPTLSGIEALAHHNRLAGSTMLEQSPGKRRTFRSEVIGRSISAAVTQKGNPI
ncbi:uncharacterized protein LOC131210492 [Anopheles bellator]|uniref:uncharacterized protein LOC131210492 n=1 Tax=Anopheles bellator TaxID=139047 RepID=UPI0026486663|nr:uncharacterized protein LOC131210492 [Anopheles bellator]